MNKKIIIYMISLSIIVMLSIVLYLPVYDNEPQTIAYRFILNDNPFYKTYSKEDIGDLYTLDGWKKIDFLEAELKVDEYYIATWSDPKPTSIGIHMFEIHPKEHGLDWCHAEYVHIGLTINGYSKIIDLYGNRVFYDEMVLIRLEGINQNATTSTIEIYVPK